MRYARVFGLDYEERVDPADLPALAGINWNDPLPQALGDWNSAHDNPPPDEHLGSVCQVFFLDNPAASPLRALRKPKYAVDEEGSIRLIDPLFLINGESLSTILRASDLGYNGPPPKEWLVVEHLAPGFGGAVEVTNFLLFFMSIVADARAVSELLPVQPNKTSSYIADMWNGIKYGDERRLAYFWESSQGILTATELRLCVDAMGDRSPKILFERLSLKNENSGKRLLKMLGYGVSEEWDGWQLSRKKKRRKARKRWKKNETKWNHYH